jgi:general secretion pathway protein M
MIDLVAKRMRRSLLFLTFNAAFLLFVLLFVVAPVLSHFSSRSEEISENVAQLSHFRSIARDAKGLIAKTARSGDPFLPGGEERVVSADLQASLKTIANSAGVRFLGVRGLQGVRSQPLRMVAVSLELEGTLQGIRDVVQAIEGQTPFLFITSAVLRSVADADEGLIQAELKVRGAMRDNALPLARDELRPGSELTVER